MLALKPEADPTADIAAVVAAARTEMDRLIQIGGLQRDPLRHPIEALSVHLDALSHLCTAMLSAPPPQATMTDAQVDRVAQTVAGRCRDWAGSMVRAANINSAAIAIATLLIMGLVGFGAGFVWRGAPPPLNCSAEISGIPICYRFNGPAPSQQAVSAGGGHQTR